MDYQDIIKIAQQILNCPVCGRNFEQEKVRLTAMIDDKVVIQASCDREHLPLMTIFITVFSERDGYSIGLSAKKEAITQSDVTKLIRTLADFEGDFKTIFV